MNQSKFFYLFTIVSLLVFSSCVSKKELLYFQDINTYNKSEVISYKNIIQENDILKIDVTSLKMEASVPYNKFPVLDNYSNNLEILQLYGYLVSSNKTIDFPVLGEINVGDKTVNDLENYLKNRLETEGHLINPNVTVRLLNSKFTVLGEVNRPGTYSYIDGNISFLQALGLAGDLTINANRKDIIIIRESDGLRTITNLDLTNASLLTSSIQNIQPNDVIIVNPNRKIVTSAGLIGDIPTFLNIASIVLSTVILIN